MRLVVIAASTFGDKVLRRVLALKGVEVPGVVTAPREFRISYRPSGVTNVLFTDLTETCEKLSIPCRVMTSGMNDPNLLEQVRSWRPDAFLVAGWYHMVPRSWRQLAPAFGLHASLLPDYSGGAPLVWAIINGETRTGITLFQMGDGVDSGPIVGQAEVQIDHDETIASLYQKVETAGLEMLDEFAPRLASPDLPLQTQDETKRRIMPQRGPEDGVMDWSWSTAALDRFIRAQTRPYPGAFTHVNGKLVRIWKAEPLPSGGSPGTTIAGRVFADLNHVCISTCDGALRLLEIERNGQILVGSEISAALQGGASAERIDLVPTSTDERFQNSCRVIDDTIDSKSSEN